MSQPPSRDRETIASIEPNVSLRRGAESVDRPDSVEVDLSDPLRVRPSGRSEAAVSNRRAGYATEPRPSPPWNHGRASENADGGDRGGCHPDDSAGVHRNVVLDRLAVSYADISTISPVYWTVPELEPTTV